MVLKGQFLERPTLIPVSPELVLEGLAHRGARTPPLLILPPPPLEGSGMDHVVGAELAFAVSRLGHSTLRFNYRGVGGSQGTPARAPELLLEDALAALELAMENAGGALAVVAAIGASDAVALELAKRRPIAGLALINPSVVLPHDLEALRLPLAVVVAELDERQDRGRWATVEGTFTVIPGATRSYQRNLPMVGKAVASLIAQVGASSANP